MTARFQRGTGCYTCSDCGKVTRETGEGEGCATLCRRCFDIAGLENALSDGSITREQFDAKVAALKKAGGR